MRPIVVDASLAVAVLFPDEWTEAVPEVQGRLRESPLFVPAHWAIEIGSILVSAEKRKRITGSDRRAYLDKAGRMPCTVDSASSIPSLAVADLAIQTGLSVYDAAYLELAERLGAALATNDRELALVGRGRSMTILTTLA